MNIRLSNVLKSGLLSVSISFILNLIILAFIDKSVDGINSMDMYYMLVLWSVSAFLLGVSINIIFNIEQLNFLNRFIISCNVSTAIVICSAFIFFMNFEGGFYSEMAIFGSISMGLIVFFLYIASFGIYYIYELSQLDNINRKLLNNDTSVKRLANLDKIITALFMSGYAIIIGLLPIATDSKNILDTWDSIQINILELKFGFLVIILLVASSLSVIVLSIIGFIRKNVTFNILGILIAALVELLVSIIIIISVILLYPDFKLTVWPFITIIFGIAGIGDALLFKKHY